MRVGSVLLLSLFLAAYLACRGGETAKVPKASSPAHSASVVGCYSLSVATLATAADTLTFGALPKRFELTHRAMPQPFPGYMVVPAVLWPREKMIGLWDEKGGDSVTVSWTTGFHGLSLYMRRTGDALLGIAQPFSDTHAIGAPPAPQVSVTAGRVECVTRGADRPPSNER